MATDLNEHFSQFSMINTLSEKTGLSEVQLVYAGLGASFLLVVLGICPALIVTIVGTAYPAIMSFKAVEAPQPDDDKQWLTYWMVFSVYHFVDTFIAFLLTGVPFYFAIKLGVLVYMFWPQTRGALKTYNLVVMPFLNQYQSKIDLAFSTIGLSAEEEPSEG